MLKRLDLSGPWRARFSDLMRGRPAFAERDTIDQKRYLPVTVPGEIHLDLMKLGLIPDVYRGANCLAARWVEEQIWSYRRTFDAPAEARQPGARAWLYFEGLDYAARIVLNGDEVGRHANFFRPCRLEVTGRLRETGNVLTVHLDSGLYCTADKPAQSYTGAHMVGEQAGRLYYPDAVPQRAFAHHNDVRLHKRPWLRKPQSQFSWDWSPRLINVGIQGKVWLEHTVASARIEQFVPLVTLSEDLKEGQVRARVFVENLQAIEQQAMLEVEIVEAGARPSPGAATSNSTPGPASGTPLGFSGVAAAEDGRAPGAVSARSGVKVTVPVTLKPGLHPVEALLKVPAPKLWWPVGHGAQPLYTITASLSIGIAPLAAVSETAPRSAAFQAAVSQVSNLQGPQSASRLEIGDTADLKSALPAAVSESSTILAAPPKRIGFRHVRVNQSPHPAGGTYFVLEVNHKPIFCKGGNLVPADMIFAALDRQRYVTLVDRALEANCNFLRVWGGGLYEHDDFYELCDEKGILVWQEFIYACSRYPTTEPEFFHEAMREAAYQIRRLAAHPSLVIWCGNNENEVGAWDWGWMLHGAIAPDHAFFHIALPRLLAEEDPTRYYQPSSPFSPNGQHPGRDDTGDQHPWSIGFAELDFRKYRVMSCRFPNEGGFLGPTSLPAMLACLGQGQRSVQSFDWQVHDNSVDSWEEPSQIDRITEFWLGKPCREMTIEQYTYWGGLIQGEALREYIENFRRRMFDNAAAIFWMFNDCWPATRSWTIVDYFLNRTPSFHPVRRAFAPVHLVVVEEGQEVVIYGINETDDEVAGELRFGLFTMAGQYPLERKASVRLKPNASGKVAAFEKTHWSDPHRQVAFAQLEQDGKRVARNRLILPLFKEMHWEPARVSVRLEGANAVFESQTYAFNVCVDLNGGPGADNYFDLFPGIPYVVPWNQPQPPKVLQAGNLS